VGKGGVDLRGGWVESRGGLGVRDGGDGGDVVDGVDTICVPYLITAEHPRFTPKMSTE